MSAVWDLSCEQWHSQDIFPGRSWRIMVGLLGGAAEFNYSKFSHSKDSPSTPPACRSRWGVLVTSALLPALVRTVNYEGRLLQRQLGVLQVGLRPWKHHSSDLPACEVWQESFLSPVRFKVKPSGEIILSFGVCCHQYLTLSIKSLYPNHWVIL